MKTVMTMNRVQAFTLIVLGLAIAAMGIVAAPLFPQSQELPSVADSAPSQQYAAAVERARGLVRAAVLEQNLPGVSVAVGAGASVAWAEGFGWRDVVTRTPITPKTRFNIGTAASAVAGAVAPLGLTNTGTDAAKEWSPEAIGEEGEDFPPLTLLRHVVWQPLGLMPAEYPLPGDRATFYVPRSEDNDSRGAMAASSSRSRQTWRTQTRPRWRCELGTRLQSRGDDIGVRSYRSARDICLIAPLS